MAATGLDKEEESLSRDAEPLANIGMDRLGIVSQPSPKEINHNTSLVDESEVKITCFSDVSNDLTLHFQIIRFPKQVVYFLTLNYSTLCFHRILHFLNGYWGS